MRLYTTNRPCRDRENAPDLCTSFLHKKGLFDQGHVTIYKNVGGLLAVSIGKHGRHIPRDRAAIVYCTAVRLTTMIRPVIGPAIRLAV
jgi:hypothetical protein